MSNLIQLGCDSTSSFYGHSKVSSWKLVTGDDKSLKSLAAVGENFENEDGLQNHLEELTCKFYKSLPETSVSIARYNLIKVGNFSDTRLPPNKDCLVKHSQRANYQAAIWKRSTCRIINAPSPFDQGWSIDGSGNISINWMDGDCAPDALLQNYNCKCKTGCLTNRCSCKKSSNFCSDVCHCVSCSNITDEERELDEVDLGETDDETASEDGEFQPFL